MIVSENDKIFVFYPKSTFKISFVFIIIKKKSDWWDNMRSSSKQDKIKRMEFYGVCILSVFTITAAFLTRPSAQERIETVQAPRASAEQNQDAATPNNPQSPPTTKKVARITASGDMLYHDIVYGSAFDGTAYDFKNDYEQITPLVSSADLAIGDF